MQMKLSGLESRHPLGGDPTRQLRYVWVHSLFWPYLRSLDHLLLSFCLESTIDQQRTQVSRPQQGREKAKGTQTMDESRKDLGDKSEYPGVPQTFSKKIVAT